MVVGFSAQITVRPVASSHIREPQDTRPLRRVWHRRTLERGSLAVLEQRDNCRRFSASVPGKLRCLQTGGTYSPLRRRPASLVTRKASPSSARNPETNPPKILRDAGIKIRRKMIVSVIMTVGLAFYRLAVPGLPVCCHRASRSTPHV